MLIGENRNMIKKALYQPHDGEFTLEDMTDLSMFATDLLGDQFLTYDEICFVFDQTDFPKPLLVLAGFDEEGDWTYSHTYAIPQGWSDERVSNMLGKGNVYFHPMPVKTSDI